MEKDAPGELPPAAPLLQAQGLTHLKEKKNVTILVLGLDGAGKSSLIKEIQRVLSCEVLPTRKPHQTELRVDRFAVSLVDLAGGPRSWGTWKNHYGTAHGIIFVLDSSDVARMEEAKKTLSRVLGHPRVSGKPLLLLANKQDHVDAILPCEVIECLSLEKLVNRNKSPCRMEPCSATKRLPKIQCWTIVQGLHWLLQTVAINYDVLCGRIQEDSPGRQRSPEREAVAHQKGELPRKKSQSRWKQSSKVPPEHPCAGQSTKKKNKMLKNKIKSQEASQTQPDENPSGTFDLYRRAMLVLKMQQERRKPPSAAAP
ncbi:ADP-ribosylation factor-like protein 13A isoform X13 [Hemicordylus capensis]|uniref:ADP-ribosylation factor-like protein 13A isoform X13 n=1 Tax=Hemicordylus capensis TaxID=884348 RepID=UPI0023033730|nr:ADP-ribosylation factor-like protein 13A isoform X13 [Hemicordylus capensis]